MPLTIVRNDITTMKVDAIVNAANTSLQAGGGVCGAIFSAAGRERLQRACDNLAPINTGEVVITRGFKLPAKHIIHAAGPVYHDGGQGEETLLRSCYINSLDLALKHRCESVAFPLISSGIYGYPKDEALTVATKAIGEWLSRNVDVEVFLVVFDKAAFTLSSELLGDVKAFIDENFVDEQELKFGRSRSLWEQQSVDYDRAESSLPISQPERKPPDDVFDAAPMAAMPPAAMANFAERLDEPFSVSLLRLIDAKGKTDVEVYKRANIDRKLFSKIRSGKGYMPSKKTVIALAIALELSASEARDLLEQAGFALSRCVLFDVIIEYFISRRKYDIYEINNVLFEYDQPLLGGDAI